MKSAPAPDTEIEEYISGFPQEVRKLLEQVRTAIRKAAPDAREAIKYGIPTFLLNGNLVHFGGFKRHIGFYPTPSAIAEFKNELSAYAGAKGSVQFPFDKPIPLRLITRIVKFRVKEARQKAVPGHLKDKK